MVDSRCFVQFSHPGREPEPDRDGRKQWNRNHLSHKRKFMQFRGQWIDQDGMRHIGDLRAWGEWEPESNLIQRLDQPGGDAQYPRYLWRPYYVPKDNCSGLHNTDPFIFGQRFLYSNCRQRSTPALRQLGDGSVIAFGSGKEINGERKWMLDTVLVVKDSVKYRCPNDIVGLDGWVTKSFWVATGAMLKFGQLYRGATFDDPVDGMFSFFPAMPADGNAGFPRPVIDLPGEYFNPSNWRASKGVKRDLTATVRRELWECLVSQVRAKGLVLGTWAEPPECLGAQQA